ncbi:MAG: hypothetical protein N7Q72_01400, partial [Spiroplasma sp. Tabriz.8]|nr:hypothetical protein [Spiroplasma sp. Tabriz.8]
LGANEFFFFLFERQKEDYAFALYEYWVIIAWHFEFDMRIFFFIFQKKKKKTYIMYRRSSMR